MAWLPHPEPWTVEAELIALMQPPLNVMANQSHPFYPFIKAARSRLEAAAQIEPLLPVAHAPVVRPRPPVGDITTAQLAEELGTEAKKLRLRLRALAAEGKIADKSGRWSWLADNPDLEVIRPSWGKKEQ